MTKLDLHRTIPDASKLAHKKLDVCLGCEHLTDENRCGLMNSDCFITAVVQWDWKACPADKHPEYDEQLANETIEEHQYQHSRKIWYPPIEEFLDAWVKQDEEALELYRQRCLEVKHRWPKPDPEAS